MNANQYCEHARAQTILVYAPELSVFVNSLHPLGALYEVPLDPANARRQLQDLIDYLERQNIKVLELFNILKRANTDDELRRLQDFAFDSLTYSAPEGTPYRFISDEYKRSVIQKLDPVSLGRIVLTKPTVNLVPSHDNTGIITTSTQFRAVGNVVFCRDQQITTQKGVVISCFSAEQRYQENDILEFCLRKVGITPIGKISDAKNATLEGGDFVAFSQNTAALGVGLRSSYSAGLYLMQHDLLGTERFIIVKDVFDINYDRMHLDCICSVLHDKLILVDETCLQCDRQRRYVDEYERRDGVYKLNPARTNVEFGEYLRKDGYQVIPLPHERQLAYGCNALHLGEINGTFTVLTVDQASKQFIEENQIFQQYQRERGVKIEIVYIPFRSITSMYGSLHCCTYVLQRAQIATPQQEKTEEEPKHFDCVLLVPTFTGSEAAVDAVYQMYVDLQAKGKNVYLLNKYKAYPKFSLWQSYGTTVYEVLDEVMSGKLDCGEIGADLSKSGLLQIGFSEKDVLRWL